MSSTIPFEVNLVEGKNGFKYMGTRIFETKRSGAVPRSWGVRSISPKRLGAT